MFIFIAYLSISIYSTLLLAKRRFHFAFFSCQIKTTHLVCHGYIHVYIYFKWFSLGAVADETLCLVDAVLVPWRFMLTHSYRPVNVLWQLPAHSLPAKQVKQWRGSTSRQTISNDFVKPKCCTIQTITSRKQLTVAIVLISNYTFKFTSCIRP